MKIVFYTLFEVTTYGLNLLQYISKFIEHGYDDLEQLFDMSSHEFADVIKEVTLYDKPGHRKRFVSALQILCSRDKHGVPDGEKAICTTIMSSASCNVSSCKSAFNSNMF